MPHVPRNELEAAIALQERALNGVLSRIDELHASLSFFESQLSLCNATPEDRTCTICLEEGLQLDRMSITRCAHVFCTKCIRECLRTKTECPVCRRCLNISDVSALSHELQSSENLPQNTLQRCFGAKIDKIVSTFKWVRRDDPTAKVLVYSQWAGVLSKIASALTFCNIPFYQLREGQERDVLAHFHSDRTENAVPILLLSLEHTASGSNEMTSANHVFIVSPMCVKSVEVAVSYEKQAIARVWRHGQSKRVRVWRFVTRHTIEDAIVKLHQRELQRGSSLSEDSRTADPAATPTLPQGWISRTSNSTGKTYYFNEKTGQSQWAPPTG